MGICLSCLGLSRKPTDPERSHLLNSDEPYNASGYGYGSTSHGLALPRHALNPEDAKREQQALEGITRWTTDAVVDIFPHQTLLNNSNSHMSPPNIYDQIPGDKSTKQIRIYPASRPASQASAQTSIRSKSSSRKDGSSRSAQPRIFRTLEMGPSD